MFNTSCASPTQGQGACKEHACRPGTLRRHLWAVQTVGVGWGWGGGRSGRLSDGSDAHMDRAGGGDGRGRQLLRHGHGEAGGARDTAQLESEQTNCSCPAPDSRCHARSVGRGRVTGGGKMGFLRRDARSPCAGHHFAAIDFAPPLTFLCLHSFTR